MSYNSQFLYNTPENRKYQFYIKKMSDFYHVMCTPKVGHNL